MTASFTPQAAAAHTANLAYRQKRRVTLEAARSAETQF